MNGFSGFNPAFANGSFGWGVPGFVGAPYYGGAYPIYGAVPPYGPAAYGPQVPVPVAVPVPVPVAVAGATSEETKTPATNTRTRTITDPKTPEDFDRERRIRVRESVAGSREEFRNDTDRVDRHTGTAPAVRNGSTRLPERVPLPHDGMSRTGFLTRLVTRRSAAQLAGFQPGERQ